MRKTATSVAALALVGVLGVGGTAVAVPAAGGNGYGGGGDRCTAACDGSGIGQQQGRAGQGKGKARRAAARSLKARIRVPAAVPGATISTEVEKALAFMAEEEKLARDVYRLAAARYPDRIFGTIATSESRHLTAVRTLLGRYDVTDPTAGKKAGVFADAELQDLYDTLAAQVRTSRDAAVQAGITVEKADIEDLEDALGLTAPSDVTTVLGRLLAASERHLAAFQRNA